jgi:arabinose-5-phosphate isomerase
VGDWLNTAKEVMDIEANAIQACAERLGDDFEKAVEAVLHCSGRIVTCGIGKSGNIARKISGTLSSTGTPSLFLHPAEALHGELGAVTENDIVLLFTNSGETDELIAILPALRRIGAKFIGVTANRDSSIGQACDIVLDSAVEREACPMNLAPTSSAAVQLALGDALAISVMVARNFTPSDYAQFHPSGTLGRRLLLHVYDIMRKDDMLAVVSEDAPLHDVLFAITKAEAGAACVVNSKGAMVGLITDGDIRRTLLRDEKALQCSANVAMNRPKFVLHGNPLAVDALTQMQSSQSKIGELPVLDDEDRPIGIVMLKDLLRAGILR